MNVLLLLSALLSAITGVGEGAARAPVAAAQVVRAGEAAVTLSVAPVAASRPVQPLATVTGRFVGSVVAAIALPAPTLYASRRRE